jgi:hypothetical protein
MRGSKPKTRLPLGFVSLENSALVWLLFKILTDPDFGQTAPGVWLTGMRTTRYLRFTTNQETLLNSSLFPL